jgi:two-component system, NarL family, sensor histidine kinase DegS
MNRAAVMDTGLKLQDPSLVMLACELHDGPCQHLMAAFCHLDTFRRLRESEPENAGNEFYHGFKLLRRGIEDLNAFLRELQPMQDQETTLVQRIEDLIQENAARHGLLVTFSHSPQDIRLPSLLTTIVLRIIQEGLANVRRHSRSRSVRLGIAQCGDSLRIEIEDWGIGFDPAAVGRGCFGIAGIQARAALLGGEACITSRPGEGTLVIVDLPTPAFVDDPPPGTADAELRRPFGSVSAKREESRGIDPNTTAAWTKD